MVRKLTRKSMAEDRQEEEEVSATTESPQSPDAESEEASVPTASSDEAPSGETITVRINETETVEALKDASNPPRDYERPETVG